MGDIKIIETDQGGDIAIKNNDIAIDSGISNNVYLAWFGGNIEANTSDKVEPGEQHFDWWGNSLALNDESKQFNSNLERKLLTTALTSAGLSEIEAVAKKDLSHLSSIAEIEVTARLIAVDTLEISALVKEKATGIIEEFSFIWDDMKIQSRKIEDLNGTDYSPEEKPPFFTDTGMYLVYRRNNSLINFRGKNAIIDGNKIIFPDILDDPWNKTNTDYWLADIPNTTGDDRTWLQSELTGVFTILYSTEKCRGTIFFKDFDTEPESVLPIIVYDRELNEAEQAEVVAFIDEYFFLEDSAGFIVQDSNNDFLTVEK